MNEKIKLLAEQAGFNISNDPIDGNDFKYEIEKFAELMIEECAELFPHTFTDEHHQRRIDKAIRKHFGVIE